MEDLYEMADRGLTFGTILINPPWDPAAREPSQPRLLGMKLEDLFALPVGRLAAKRSHVHLLVPPRFITTGFKLLDHWDVEHKSDFVACYTTPEPWPSDYWRDAHDHLLLGVRGTLVFRDHSIRSWQLYERCPNGCRPEQVRRYIERAGVGPRLELFGRHQADGWSVWGTR